MENESPSNSSNIVSMYPDLFPPRFFRSSYYTTELLEKKLENIQVKLQAADKSEALRMMIILFESSDVEIVMQLKKRAYRKTA